MRPEWDQLRTYPEKSVDQLLKMLHPSSRLYDQYQERKIRLEFVYQKLHHFNMPVPSWADDNQSVEPMDEYAQDKEIHELEEMRSYYQDQKKWWK